ncbi:hypothetical protein Tco_0255622 [Tanacetum coccineum]
MADSCKSMDLNKFVLKDDMIDYVLHKYESNWQVHDAIADDILDDLLKRKWEKQQRVKYYKRKVTEMKILDLLEQRISRVGKHVKKAKEKMDINKEKEKMVMERAIFDESYDHNPFQVSYDDKILVALILLGNKKKLLKWYDAISSDEQRTVYKGSTCTTLFVPTKRPPLVTNCVLGIVAVTTRQQILNKEFGIKRSKEDVGGSSDVRRKGKRKML